MPISTQKCFFGDRKKICGLDALGKGASYKIVLPSGHPLVLAAFLKKVGIWPRECARTIENISRIRMDVARASGTDLASSLRQNTFLIEKN